MISLVEHRSTIPMPLDKDAVVEAGYVMRFSDSNAGYFIQMSVSGSTNVLTNDVTHALCAGLAIEAGNGGSSADGTVTIQGVPIYTGDFVDCDCDAGSGNLIAVTHRGYTVDFKNAGYLELDDATLASNTIGVKVLQILSGLGSRYGKVRGMII